MLERISLEDQKSIYFFNTVHVQYTFERHVVVVVVVVVVAQSNPKSLCFLRLYFWYYSWITQDVYLIEKQMRNVQINQQLLE